MRVLVTLVLWTTIAGSIAGCRRIPDLDLDGGRADAMRADGDAPAHDGSLDDGSIPSDAPPRDSGPPPPPLFVDIAAAAGLAVSHGEYRRPPTCRIDDPEMAAANDHCDAEWALAGVAAGDHDGDGDPDLFVTRLDSPASLYENRGGSFVDVTDALGLRIDEPTAGAAFADVDRDGDVDLYVTSAFGHAHRLFLREGATYREAAAERGAALPTAALLMGTTPVFGDYDQDGDLDLYVGEWRNRRIVHDGPALARLLRNRGPSMPGYFEDVTASAGVSMESAWEGVAIRGIYAYGAAFADLDSDGFTDLAISGDFRTSRLFWGRAGGTFTDGTFDARVGTETNAMGSSLADFDGDGDLDWFVTSIWMRFPGADWGNRLYRYDGARTFTDVTTEAGVLEAGWAWGTALFDWDNDGDVDLFATNGWELPYHVADETRAWRNGGDMRFTEVAREVGLYETGHGRGIAVLDHDADGDLDLFVARYGGVPSLYENQRGNEQGWIRVRAHGTRSAIDGRGAMVRVTPRAGDRPIVALIGSTTTYLGHSELVAHIGLGAHEGTVSEVRVQFPGGGVATLRDVEIRRTIDVVEP